ncbi:putative FBD-associated F-box protein At5g56410 [Arabidopsis lyrata subsp. lyrata]|uniref:putative FBD-associated F-box protein At5g56410 n=1 Tax=Arabidopsis lyrata subsp. lyrata TaxID=81972 RepID=UPI000A29BE09|nr:putative FBD-associated F-box protein At5g56410 [Arabidopsis lyrata subsp. lyrata]|eukprot:XP_020869801.1 putative FBD-associated F-box protein At5g56410 [Arabidopsis lyrata subsp. lyrata]
MDKISGFSDDELLVKILSFLPTKDAVSTSTLSKRWKFLWMRVPKLEYDEKSIYPKEFYCQYMFIEGVDRRKRIIASGKSQRMRRFIDRNLPLHISPLVESFRLVLFTEVFQPQDIKLWVEIAISRCVEELSVTFTRFKGKPNALLPSSLYTCKSLVTLKLKKNILVDVPHVFCLPSLKTLHLERVTYADEESLQRLLTNCSVLEDLVVERHQGDNVRKFSVIIPTLLSLSFTVWSGCSSDGYMIDTPSLKYFKYKHLSKSTCLIVKNMPKLEEAQIFTAGHNIKKLLQSLTSVKLLSLLVAEDNTAETVYGDDVVFNKLEHLNFGIRNTFWSKLLFWLLNASPKLRDFKFSDQYSRVTMDTLVWWNQLSSVPQCLLSSLQTFEWSGDFFLSVQGKDVAKYILRNSCFLKTATITLGPGLDPQKHLDLELETEIRLSSPSSPTCNLVFNQHWDWGWEFWI